MRALGTVLSQGCVQCHPGADKSDLHLSTGRGLQPGGGLGVTCRMSGAPGSLLDVRV